ncbi:haloacid dehalogenase superfamily, subfamily IA, variant 3 with third motif having DD or ED [Actinopolyspora xinjiangensis]|uniref:Haloacid dehalogenase superfamily, subfamily IA, variant 3 with third motif having DD or ED n=1 Tax=Actinopolyspora xinjiangensis TaxID=405564 RepID=A0A1H0WI07_9ACTN|nr:HAD family phosphatase [Actinopolyspora xinjiangensis]SDP90370.1 haloacid dehalogenase superfamily, subfamily IA, variant 3 with third motif having DD or ED [Actinopolyspora xinjiangensis]
MTETDPHAAGPHSAAAAPELPAAVLFDMDGTLVDSEKLWTVAMDDYAAAHDGEISDAARASMVGSNMSRSMRLLLADLGMPTEPADVEAAGQWVVARMSEMLSNDLTWRPGAEGALRRVSASGVPVALVTSTIRSLTDIALRTIGTGVFDVTVCGDEVDGRNKPDPEPYLRACRRLGVDPRHCVAVEDSPTGVSSAVAAGCAVLGVACEVPLNPELGCTLRDSLEGIDAVELGSLLRRG